jgi:Fur family ferric uptake transcriptional regulator
MGQLVQTLKERGHRLTPQRQLILEAIEAAEGHVSAETVHARVAAQFPQVNISTVYRTLELLQNLGLVTHTHFDDGIALYHLSEDSHHQHMVCRQCGAEREIDVDELAPLDRHLRAQYRFRADLAHFAIIGICGSCYAAAQADEPPGPDGAGR